VNVNQVHQGGAPCFGLLIHCRAFVVVGVCGVGVDSLLPFLWAVAGEVSFPAAVEALAIGTAILSLVVHLGNIPLSAPVVLVFVVVISTVLVVGGM
jgi:hypothetical protein